MVTTNLASRGLDFSNVHHVVMYDFPLNLADYLHRIGRTARGGRAGRVTTITPRRYWPFVTKIQEASKHGKAVEVHQPTKTIKKMLKLEAYSKVVGSDRFNKSQKRYLRKRLGVAQRSNLGTREAKLALKRLKRRAAAVKRVRFLWKRGILKKGHGLPPIPDAVVSATETQTTSTLVRARDGLLQIMPKRRRPTVDEPVTEVVDSPPLSESKSMQRRRRRTIM